MSRARDNANLSPTIPDARMPNLTGDVTTSEGAVATTIANDAVSLAKMAGGTDGNLITYDTSGDPAYVATGTSGHVLTSAGAEAVPAFAAAAAGGTTSNFADDGWHVTQTVDAAYFEGASILWPATPKLMGTNVTYENTYGSIEVDNAGVYLILAAFVKENSTDHFNFHLKYKTSGGSFANVDDGRIYAVGSWNELYYRATISICVTMAAGSFLQFHGDGKFDGTGTMTYWQGIKIL